MIPIKTIRQALIAARHEAQLFQNDLADISGVHQCTISAFECGKLKNPRWTTIQALFESCGFEVVLVPTDRKPTPSKDRRGRPRKSLLSPRPLTAKVTQIL